MRRKKTRKDVPVRRKTGMPPGSLVFTGQQKIDEYQLDLIQYNQEHHHYTSSSVDEVLQKIPGMVNWVDLRGLHDTEVVEKLGRAFKLHPLVLEDVLDVHHRPKFELYEDGIFIIARHYSFKAETLELIPEQISIYVGADYLISFQETDSDLFLSVRVRLERGRGRIRGWGSDYLCYALLDRVVDDYFNMLDLLSETIETLEEKITRGDTDGIRDKIHQLKSELTTLRRSVAPLREAINMFGKADSPLVSDTTGLYLRDLYDHVIQVLDAVEMYREMLTGMQDLYISELSFRMNKVMQVLTIVATIFIPLTFLVGVYGMNFKHMPELDWPYSYPLLWVIMLLVVLVMLRFFYSKKWL